MLQHTKSKILPPHNFIAEEIIIGNLIISHIFTNQIINITNYAYFVLDKHTIIYLTIIEIYEKDKEINLVTLIQKLWLNKNLQKTGGIHYIFKCIRKAKSLYSHPNLKKHLYHFTSIIYQNYIQRLLIQYSYYIIQLNYTDNLSLNTIYNQFLKYQKKINTCINQQWNYEWTADKSLSHFLASWDTTIKLNRNIKKILFGFRDLDTVTQGFKTSDLIIIAGRPSMGKTSLGLNIAYSIIQKQNLAVYIFSLEMSNDEILEKLLSLGSQIPIESLQKQKIQTKQWWQLQKSSQRLAKSKLQIDDEYNTTIHHIKNKIQNLNANTTIIIDYLQLITVQPKITENRTQEIGYITRELKLLAKTYNCPIILLSQLNRNIENRVNKRPLLSDLRESGCVSSYHLPKHTKIPIESTESLKCTQKYYYKDLVSVNHFSRNKQQYLYSSVNTRCPHVDITHNHQLLTENSWHKTDQIKYLHCYISTISNHLNYKNMLEFQTIKNIVLTIKSLVYDVTINEYCNFIIQNNIVHNSIEQDADLILMLYKDLNNEKQHNETLDIIIAKHRSGPIGAFQLLFYPNTCQFQDLQIQV